MNSIAKYLSASLVLAGALFVSVAATNAQSAYTAPAQQCYALSSNFGRGFGGPDVSSLQSILIRENLLHIAQPTGYFGNLTVSATVAFQAKYGILQTGFVGPLTRAKISSLYGCGVVTTPFIAGPGQHCGGNMANAPVCMTGYYCAPTPGTSLPFGDVGGICTSNIINNNQSPVINGVSGPTTLNIGQTGTWSITASDPLSTTLSYSVVWGDQVLYPSNASSASGNIVYNQTATFTHAYSNAGNYTPVFYVQDSNGNTASTSLSVNVGNSYANQPSINFLQPNAGAVGTSVTITGNGFTPTGNRIVFGNSGSENNPAYSLSSFNNGTSITFIVPYTNYVACLNSVPACMIAQQLIQPGTYPVSVINANGTSNQVLFTVTSSTATHLGIQYLQPNSGVVGSTITIVGNGFTNGGNTINFGNGTYQNFSSNGNSIYFTIPSYTVPACSYSSNPCPFAQLPVNPGTYNISVTNSYGTSNTATFTVTSQTSCTPNWQCGWGPCTNGYQGMTAIDTNNCGIYNSSTGTGIACPALARQCTN
jgi:hypothetical protein